MDLAARNALYLTQDIYVLIVYILTALRKPDSNQERSPPARVGDDLNCDPGFTGTLVGSTLDNRISKALA